MHNITLKYLKLINFCTYKEQEFDFDYLFDGSNCLFISGNNEDDSFENDNGAGKSLIYEGLLFLIENKTARKSRVANLVGEFASSMSVEGTFRDENTSDIIKVIRYRNDKVHGNQVLIWINDKPVKAKSTPTEQGKYLERLLNTSYDGLLNTNILEGNDKKTRFIYMDDKSAKELISSFGGLNVFSVCHSIVSDYDKKYDKELRELNLKLDEINNFLKSKKLDIKNNKRLINITKEQMDEAVKEANASKEKHNNKVQEEINNIQEKMRLIKGRIEKRKQKIKESDTRYKKVFKQSEKISSELLTVVGDLSLITYEIKNLRKQKESIAVGICKECKQYVSKKHMRKQHKEIDEQINLLLPKEKKLVKLKESLGEREKETSFKLSKAEKKLNINRLKIGTYESELKHLKNNRNNLWDQLENNSKIESLEKALNDNLSAYKQQLKSHKDKYEKIKTRKNKILKRIRKISNLQKYIKAWKKGFSREEIQAASMSSIIGVFNERMAEIAETVTDGRLEISIQTAKPLKNGKIKSVFEVNIKRKTKHGVKQLPINEWSKGQKKRIEIISSLAFEAISPSAIDIVFLDELFNGVDLAGVSRIVNFLKSSNRKFVIFSHSKAIMKMFPNRGIVTLRNGCSSFSHRRIS